MAEPTTGKRVRITDPVEARVELVNGAFALPDDTKVAMNQVRAAAEAYARALKAAINDSGVVHDKGRLIAALDAVQHSKDIACVALILPHVEK